MAPTGFVKARYITWLPSYGFSNDNFTTTVEVTPGQYVTLREKPSTTATSIICGNSFGRVRAHWRKQSVEQKLAWNFTKWNNRFKLC